MRIERVVTTVIPANFDWTIVQIEDSQGNVGLGESFMAPGLVAILDELATLLVGRDPRQVTGLVERLYLATSGAGSTGGVVLNAISGLDAALWDLAARRLGVPLWQLLGGRVHDQVRVYADCHAGTALASLDPLLRPRPAPWTGQPTPPAGRTLFEPDPHAEPVPMQQVRTQAAKAAAAGYDALKFDLDGLPELRPAGLGGRHLPPSVVPTIIEYLQAIRDGAGDRVDIALDCHWRYDQPTAAMITQACADAGLLWLEDPLPPDDLDGLIELARRCPVPLATGENLSRWSGFAALIEARAVSVVTPDLGKVGGLTQARLIAQTAHERAIAVAPHNIAGPVGTAYAAQLACTWPHLIALEHHAADVPFFDNLIHEGPLIVGGRIPITDRPGIGVTLNPDAVRAHARPGGTVLGAERAR